MSEAITNLGEIIASLVDRRAKTDLTNVDTTGQAYISKTAEVKFNNMMGAPVGSVIAYMGTDEPEGYLLMDGRELNRETYADLFAAIGTSQGAGDGSTTFNIADMRDGRYLMGSTVAGLRISAGLPNILGHSGTLRGADDSGNADWGGAMWRTAYPQGAQSGYTGNCSNIAFDASRSNAMYGASDTVRPLSLSTNYFIKY